MSFSLRAADCYSLLKSGSLLSVCAVIEKFQPPSVPLFLPLLSSLYPSFPAWHPSLPFHHPETSSLSFSFGIFASPLYLNSLSSLVWLIPSPPFLFPPLLSRLLSFRTNAADFDHLRPDRPAESTSRGGWEKGGETQNCPGRKMMWKGLTRWWCQYASTQTPLAR